MNKMVKGENGLLVEKDPAPEIGSGTSPGRVSGSDRRTAILDCADHVFQEKGFQAASMSAIAARLGGSKGTLYNYFTSKEELFIATVSRHCAALQEQMSMLVEDDHKDLPETLRSLGRRYLATVSSDEMVRKVRMIVGEAERAPELGRAFYETGPARGAAQLATYLERKRDEGLLEFDNSLRSARQFLSLCDNGMTKARWPNAKPAPTAAEIEEEVAAAVRVFLAAYGAGAAAHKSRT